MKGWTLCQKKLHCGVAVFWTWLGKEGEHKEEHRCLHLVAAAFERLHYPEIVLIVV